MSEVCEACSGLTPSATELCDVNSDFIWDFGKLPFSSHLGKYLKKNGKIRPKKIIIRFIVLFPQKQTRHVFT